MPKLHPVALILGATVLLVGCGERTEDVAAAIVDKAGATACEAVDLGGNATEMIVDTAAHVAVQQGLVDQGQASEIAGVVRDVRQQLPGRNPEDCRAIAGGLAKVGGSALKGVVHLAR